MILAYVSLYLMFLIAIICFMEAWRLVKLERTDRWADERIHVFLEYHHIEREEVHTHMAKKKDFTFKEFALYIAKLEGKKKSEDIAQIREQLSITLQKMANLPHGVVARLLSKYVE